jgi:ATP-binding protein involved in chromosome partitioning
MPDVTIELVRSALSKVEDPELKKDLVSLGMVKDIQVEGGKVTVEVQLTTPACPLKDKIRKDCEDAVKVLPGVTDVVINLTAKTTTGMPRKEAIPGVKNVVAVASGKGGVGKSSLAVNLALALSRTGAKVGILDADIYGPSIPIMLGIPYGKKPPVDDNKIIPHEKFGLKIMSVGFFVEEDKPLIWRGPMLNKTLETFIRDVNWGELDYLIVDLPPGTGDVQLSVSQMLPITCGVIVTTPQDVALKDVIKAAEMFRALEVPICGVVDNMSVFTCDGCGKEHKIFGDRSAERVAKEVGGELLGEIPIDISVASSGDKGAPLLSNDEGAGSNVGGIITAIAEKMAGIISMINYQSGQRSAG